MFGALLTAANKVSATVDRASSEAKRRMLSGKLA